MLRGWPSRFRCHDRLPGLLVTRRDMLLFQQKHSPRFPWIRSLPVLVLAIIEERRGISCDSMLQKKKKVIFRERKSEDRWKNYCNYRARLCTGLRLIFSTFVQRIDRSFESRLTRVKLWYSFFHTNLAFSPSFFLFLGKIDLCIHIYRFN